VTTFSENCHGLLSRRLPHPDICTEPQETHPTPLKAVNAILCQRKSGNKVNRLRIARVNQVIRFFTEAVSPRATAMVSGPYATLNMLIAGYVPLRAKRGPSVPRKHTLSIKTSYFCARTYCGPVASQRKSVGHPKIVNVACLLP
jgi:hypothetical protein